MAKRFDYYLQQVKSNQSVNFTEMAKAAQKINITKDVLLNVFSVSKNFADKAKHQITVLDDETFTYWLEKFNKPNGFIDRTDASKGQSRSHQVKLSSVLMHFRQGIAFPFSILIDKSGVIEPKLNFAHSLLIIENEEVFNNILLAQDFLLTKCGLDLSEMDILLGGGNKAANSYLHHLYNNYQQIYCFFDLELGGLRTAKSIINGTGHPNIKFVTPDSILTFIENHGKKLSSSHYQPLREIRISTPELKLAVDVMLRTQKRLEQEAYL